MPTRKWVITKTIPLKTHSNLLHEYLKLSIKNLFKYIIVEIPTPK